MSYPFLHICCLSGNLSNLPILLESFAETSEVQYLFDKTRRRRAMRIGKNQIPMVVSVKITSIGSVTYTVIIEYLEAAE